MCILNLEYIYIYTYILFIEQHQLSRRSGNGNANANANANQAYAYSQSQQQTRHARRLYFGGIPPQHADEDIFKLFLNSTIAQGLQEVNDSSYIVSLYINSKKCFAFVELKSIELTTACLELDGLIYRNSVLRVQRANEYKPELVHSLPRAPIKLDLGKIASVHTAGVLSLSDGNASSHVDCNIGSLIASCNITTVEDGAVVLLGFPYDEGGKRAGATVGAASGPRLVRRFIRKLTAVSNPEYGIDLLASVRIQDVGDIPIGLALEEAQVIRYY